MQALAALGDEFRREERPHLAWLVSLRYPDGLPLVIHLARRFFHREVEADPEMFRSLTLSRLENAGAARAELRRLSDWAADGLWPDLVVLLEVPATVAMSRLGATPDRMEAAGEEFHERVARGYRALAATEADRWVVVDGTASPEHVAAAVWRAVVERLPDLADSAADAGAEAELR